MIPGRCVRFPSGNLTNTLRTRFWTWPHGPFRNCWVTELQDDDFPYIYLWGVVNDDHIDSYLSWYLHTAEEISHQFLWNPTKTRSLWKLLPEYQDHYPRWWDATTLSGSVRSGAWNDEALAGLASASGSGKMEQTWIFGASFEWWLATLVWFSRNMNATCIWTKWT